MIAFNASTLILLAKGGLLELFLENIGQAAFIPKEVERECCEGQQSLDALLIRKAIDEKRITVVAARNRKWYGRILRDFPLGKGEAEAIALAVAEKAALLGIDDRQGINACKLLGIPFTTAIGILIRMREKGLLGSGEARSRLEALAKYGRYSAVILKEARRRLEEMI